MSMSLEDLLAKEGFNKRITKTMPRASSDIRCHDLKSKHRMSSYYISSNVKRISISSFDEFLSAEGCQNNEIIEVEERNDSRYNRIYSNRTYRNESSSAEENTEKCLDKSSKVGCQKHMERLETSNSRSTKSSVTMKSTDATTSLTKGEIEHTTAIPALDEVAIQAVISILSGHIKRFLVDEDFRTSLRHNSFASLNFIGFEEGLNTESKIIATLEQAIETAERAAEDFASEKELKKASLQLSVITGLNSDGKFTSGIPNSKLAACAHLYLSVIYKIQNKDRIAAKHLLQVFCDSPFQARTSLLHDLWNRVFLPHLSHLKVWHDSEANFLRDLRNKSRKLKLLDKLYTENLDKGTYLFAVYYKDWLTEGAEIPLLPSIQIPCISVSRQGSFSNLSSSVGGFSPQPVVSKKLYDEVFRRSHILGGEPEESYEISVRNPATLTYSAEVIK